jgi:hypothetical protein
VVIAVTDGVWAMAGGSVVMFLRMNRRSSGKIYA